MDELFKDDRHHDNYYSLALELGFQNLTDPYWRSLLFILSSNPSFLSYKHKLLDYNDLGINPDFFFSGHFSSGETSLLKLAYNLFTSQETYETPDGHSTYVTPSDVFSSLDSEYFEVALNAIRVRFINK